MAGDRGKGLINNLSNYSIDCVTQASGRDKVLVRLLEEYISCSNRVSEDAPRVVESSNFGTIIGR